MEKGKDQMRTEDTNLYLTDPEILWQGGYTRLMMEQIRNSQEEYMVPANHQVNKSYIHNKFTRQLNTYYTYLYNIKIKQSDCKKGSK
jgi:hypothetical protein